MIKAIVADDHNLVRQGIIALLERDATIQVIAEASDGQEAYDLTMALKPDVLIIDISMPRLTGIQALEKLQQENIRTHTLVLSMYADAVLVQQVFQYNAKGYLLKNVLKEELVMAVRKVSRGEVYLSQAISAEVVRNIISPQPEVSSPVDLLSAREKEVWKLIAEGLTNQSIAHELGISVKTVEKHRASLQDKLGIHDTANLVKLAIQHHLIFPDS